MGHFVFKCTYNSLNMSSKYKKKDLKHFKNLLLELAKYFCKPY